MSIIWRTLVFSMVIGGKMEATTPLTRILGYIDTGIKCKILFNMTLEERSLRIF